jgi:hypothetical protein
MISGVVGIGYVYLVYRYYTRIYPSLDDTVAYPRAMRIISIIVTPGPVIFFILFQFVSPGVITSTNVLSYLALYPPDGKIYRPSLIPGTWWPAVPRAHYCRWTSRWVAKFDHYCPWVAQPIGERNMRLFLMFLVSCFLICFVGGIGFIAQWRTKPRRDDTRTFWQRLRAITDLSSAGLDLICSMAGVIGADVALVFFIGGVCWQCSMNVTALELMRQKRWRKDNPEDEFVNMYDKGFVANWKAVFCPPVAAEHHPYYPALGPAAGVVPEQAQPEGNAESTLGEELTVTA